MNNEEVMHEQPMVVHETDHASHGHHKQSFITKYIFSQDHKMISHQFVITGIIWAVIGGFFSVIFRLQLGFPDQTLSLIHISEPTRQAEISYAVFCLKKKKK